MAGYWDQPDKTAEAIDAEGWMHTGDIGVLDDKYGEELMVWIRLRSGADLLSDTDLRAFCTGKLAYYKIPRYIRIVDEFPMTVTGKVRKLEMRRISAEQLGRPASR